MPSSLTVNLSSALVFSTRPPVSVCGTGPACVECLADFLGSVFPAAVTSPRGLGVLSRLASSPGFAWGSLRLTASTRYSVSARAFHCSVSTSPHVGVTECLPFVHRGRCALALRSRLTLIRLALIRNPWSSGGRVSRPPCRYLYLHLLFRGLHRASRHGFGDCRNAPLPTIAYAAVPWLRQRTYARVLSTRSHSTSELLRTL